MADLTGLGNSDRPHLFIREMGLAYGLLLLLTCGTAGKS